MLWFPGVVLFWFALVAVGLTVVLPVVVAFVEAFVGTAVETPVDATGVVEDVMLLGFVGVDMVPPRTTNHITINK